MNKPAKHFLPLLICSLGFALVGIVYAESNSAAAQESTNRPPELEPIGDKTIETGEEFLFVVFAADPDGDFLTYTLSVLPPGATFTKFDGVGNIYYIFRWTPTFAQRGTYSTTFFAEDPSGAVDLETIDLISKEVISDEDIIAPLIRDVAVVDRTGNSAIISWATNELATGKIEYGTSVDYGMATPFTADSTMISRQTVENLQPGTLYRYRVVAKDEAGNESFSGGGSFSTISTQALAEVDLRLRIASSQLARVQGDPRVYYITKGGLKKWIRNPAIFHSYSTNRWEDVVVVSPGDLDIYPEVNLVRREGDYKVYKIEGDTKRWIKTAEVFTRLGYDWNKILSINDTELSFFGEGSVIE